MKTADYIPLCHPEHENDDETGYREYFKNDAFLYAEKLFNEDKALKKKSKGKHRWLFRVPNHHSYLVDLSEQPKGSNDDFDFDGINSQIDID